MPLVIGVQGDAKLWRKGKLVAFPSADYVRRVARQSGVGICTIRREIETTDWPRSRSEFDAVALRGRSVNVHSEIVHDCEQLDVLPIDVERGDVDAEAVIGRLRF